MPRPTAVASVVLAVASLIGMAGCGGSDTRSSDPSVAASSADVPAPLSFTANVLGGGQLDGASLAGRAVMLWFWAPT